MKPPIAFSSLWLLFCLLAACKPSGGESPRAVDPATNVNQNVPADPASSTIEANNATSDTVMVLATVREMAARDPDAALDYVRAMPVSNLRDSAFSAALGVITAKDPKRARQIVAEWSPLQVGQYIGSAAEIAAALAVLDSGLAEDFLTEDVAPVRRAAIWGHMVQYLNLMPASAARFYKLIPDGELRLITAGELVKQWTVTDPVAAAAWFDGVVAGLDPGESKTFFGFGEAVVHLSGRSPEKPHPPEVLAGAKRAYESARQPMARQLLARHYLAMVARNHPEQLVDLTAAIEAETAGVSTSVAKRQMYEDPAGYAAALTPEEIKALPPQSMESLCLAWGSSDPPAAAAWFSGQGKLELLYHPMRTWFTVNPDPAAAFLLTLPPGNVRDSIARELSGAAARESKPALVKSLLQSIQDPSTRAWAEKRVEDIQRGNR